MHRRAKARHLRSRRSAGLAARCPLLCCCSCLTSILLAGIGCESPSAPDLSQLPVDTRGYEVEELPFVATASYVRGDDVYLGLYDGRVLRSDDRVASKLPQEIGNPFGSAPRLVFATARGVVFVSADNHPLYRADSAGATWTVCLDSPVWRMDEDDLGNLYAGNYTTSSTGVATLYKSMDAGLTWRIVFQDPYNRHIHTVRWDDVTKRLYLAFGDGPARGEARSDDRGETFQIIGYGPHDGHTDVTFTTDYVIWCSDDQSGRVYRVSRRNESVDTLMELGQFIWFGCAGAQQVYLGSVTARPGQRAVLLASSDQGRTWQALLATPESAGAYDQLFYGESRVLSAAGWLYVVGTTDGELHSYRIRRVGT